MATAETATSATSASAHSSPEKFADSSRNGFIIFLTLLPFVASLLFSLRESPAPRLAVTGQQPSLVFNEYLIHFGDRPVPAQPVLTPTFLFRNVGETTVKLEKLLPSCGCLTPKASIDEIAPGESGQLVLPIRTAGEQPGFHEYTVNVRYSDPKPREVTLAVKVVLPEHSVILEPKALFLMGKFSEDLEHEVTVTDLRDRPLSVRDVTCSADWLTPRVTSRSYDEEGTRTVIGIRVTGAVPSGTQRAIVHVSTSDPDYPLLQVPVVIRVRERAVGDEVIVQPELVNLEAVVSPAKRKQVEVTFPAAWKLSHIDSFPLELETEFRQVTAGDDRFQRLQVQISLTQLPETAVQHGVLTIVANEGQQVVSIPVQFVWSAASIAP